MSEGRRKTAAKIVDPWTIGETTAVLSTLKKETQSDHTSGAREHPNTGDRVAGASAGRSQEVVASGCCGEIALLEQGDITKIGCDAIVNAANKSLINTSLKGHDVDAAIHNAAGAVELLTSCRELGGCAVGGAKATPAFNLSQQCQVKKIFHAVGPVGRKNPGSDDELLSSCYESCLDLCMENQCRSIAFPCIATGIHGFPSTVAADIAVSTVTRWMRRRMQQGEPENRNKQKSSKLQQQSDGEEEADANRNTLQAAAPLLVVFCLFSSRDVVLYRKALHEHCGGGGGRDGKK